jgi:acyl-homoserine-lactone acylase
MMSKRLSFLVFVLAVCTGVSGNAAAWDNASGLAKKVEIRRTEYGVPHILAENERAMGFGLAYAQAEDHIESIMRLIIRARGESARYLGATEGNIRSDFWYGQYRIHERATETFKYLDRDWRHITEGFAQGLNYYIALHRDELPDWVQPVTKYDVAAHGLAGVSRFSLNRGGIVTKLQKKLGAGELALARGDEDEEMGSNLWAFAPSRTKSGNAILMGNPHQAWSEVATYYEAQVTVPGKVNFYGSTFIGRPVLTTGFNEHLGWTHTVNYPDIEEIYALHRSGDDPNRFYLDDRWIEMESRDVTVRYPDAKGEMTSETRTFYYTEWGPVVYLTDDLVYVHRPVGYFDFRYYQHWYRLGQAENFDDWRAELDKQIMPMFNTGYADDAGNIYYRWNGSVPVLPEGSHQDEAVYVTSAEQIWTEYVPPRDMPQVKNPTGGYVMNSNSTPYHTNLFQVMNPAVFPAYFPKPRFSLRSQLSMHLIHNAKKFGLEDVVHTKFSQRSMLAERVKDDLLVALRWADLSGEERAALELVRNWNNTTARDTTGSVIFQEWWTLYRKDKGVDDLHTIPWDFHDPIETPDGLADEDRAVEAFREAVAEVQKRWGSIDVTWGDVHRIRFGEIVDLPIGGAGNDMGSFRVIGYKDDPDGKRRARTGDGWVFAVEFGETPVARSVVAYSQSGREDSPHFADQAPLFADNQMKKVAFTEEDIARTLIKKYHPGEE